MLVDFIGHGFHSLPDGLCIIKDTEFMLLVGDDFLLVLHMFIITPVLMFNIQ